MFPVIYQPKFDEGDDGDFGLSAESQFINKYGVYPELLYLFANGDLTKINDITKMEATSFLFWTSFLIEKKMIEKKR